MDSYAIARADSRIQELEYEIRRLKLETDGLRADVKRLEWDTRPQPSTLGIFCTGVLWAIPACAFGLLLGQVIGRGLKALLA